jgi:hypothetical protein
MVNPIRISVLGLEKEPSEKSLNIISMCFYSSKNSTEGSSPGKVP